MPQKSVFATLTPLPLSVTREAALAFVHDHASMIRLNPLVIRHELADPHDAATAEEARDCTWYSITDKIALFPGLPPTNEVTYKAAFYDLPDGLQTHVFAPGGVDIRGRWMVGGNLPGEPREPLELGSTRPVDRLYLREEVTLRCNMLFTRFVKRNLKKSHAVVVNSLVDAAPPVEPEAEADGDVTAQLPAQEVASGHNGVPHNGLGEHAHVRSRSDISQDSGSQGMLAEDPSGMNRQKFAAELEGTSFWPMDSEPQELDSRNALRP